MSTKGEKVVVSCCFFIKFSLGHIHIQVRCKRFYPTRLDLRWEACCGQVEVAAKQLHNHWRQCGGGVINRHVRLVILEDGNYRFSAIMYQCDFCINN